MSARRTAKRQKALLDRVEELTAANQRQGALIELLSEVVARLALEQKELRADLAEERENNTYKSRRAA